MENQDENSYINTVFFWGLLIAVISCLLLPVSPAGFVAVFLVSGLLLGRAIKKHVSSRKHLACWLYGYVATVVWGISFSGYISHRIGSFLFMIAFFLMYKLARKIKKEKEQVQH